tara:strand:- start:478 stop:747 length:270 start_codon:yes stop_codon:yes gene_type:complete
MVLIHFKEINMSNDLRIEAAVFKRVIDHLKENTEIQNIDIMETAGFCRNCLSRWYREEAQKIGVEISEDVSKEIVYGMPYDAWKEKFQK